MGVRLAPTAAATSGHGRAATLARDYLARAAGHAREEDAEALTAHLARFGAFILEHGTRRERALLRALEARRTAHPVAGSVYREAISPPSESFVEAELAPPQLEPEAMRDIAASRRVALQMAGGRRIGVLLAAVLASLPLVAFIGIWELLTPAGQTEDASGPLLALLLTVLVVVALVLVGVRLVQSRALGRQLLSAELAADCGRLVEAVPVLERISRSRHLPLVAMRARLGLSLLANRTGHFARAVDEVDHALAIASRAPSTRALASEWLTPSLLAERALALAALGRDPEAEAELAHLIRLVSASAAPTGCMSARTALLRVRLVEAVRAGDIEEAARLARARQLDSDLDLRVDLLADVALVAAGGVDAAFRERVLSELRALPEVRAWIDLVAGDQAPRLRLAA